MTTGRWNVHLTRLFRVRQRVALSKLISYSCVTGRDRRLIVLHSSDAAGLPLTQFPSGGESCAAIKLHADNREEVVQEGLSPIKAEILCAAKNRGYPRVCDTAGAR
jgi:hypothetical protein